MILYEVKTGGSLEGTIYTYMYTGIRDLKEREKTGKDRP